jgi:hypothetical protein
VIFDILTLENRMWHHGKVARVTRACDGAPAAPGRPTRSASP